MLFCRIFLSFYFCISFTFGCNYTNDESVLINAFSSANMFIANPSNTFINNKDKLKADNNENLWKGQYIQDYKNERIKFGVGLLMCNNFATHVHCTQSLYAFRFAKSMMASVQSTQCQNGSTIKKDIQRVAKLNYETVLNLMNMLYVIGYVPAKYMVSSILYSNELMKMFSYESMMTLSSKENLKTMGIIAMSTAQDFIDKCDGVLTGRPAEFLVLDTEAESLADIENYLIEFILNLTKFQIDLVLYKSSNRFDPKNWLLNDLFTNTEIMNKFFFGQVTYLNISWNNLQTNLNTSIPTQKTSSKWDMYNNSISVDSHQNKLKLVYRTVVNRFLLIGVLDCDYLFQHLNIKAKDKCTETCEKIEKVINDAISFLQEDLFLTELLPFVRNFIKNGIDYTWFVFNMILSELNNLSTILGVEASNPYEPTEVLTVDNGIMITNQHLDAAIEYTKTLKNSLEDQFFGVINVIQSSVNNEWMMSTITIEKERTDLMMSDEEKNKMRTTLSTLAKAPSSSTFPWKTILNSVGAVAVVAGTSVALSVVTGNPMLGFGAAQIVAKAMSSNNNQ